MNHSDLRLVRFLAFPASLCVGLVLVVSGCGGGDQPENSGDDQGAQAEGDPEQGNSEDPQAENPDESINEELGTTSSDLLPPDSNLPTVEDDVAVEERKTGNQEQEFLYSDGSVKTRCHIDIYTLFDANDPSKGHWKFHGPYEEFYPGGATLSKGAYQDHQRSGEWVFSYEDGTVAKQGAYRDGKPDGKWSYWRADGSLEREESYAAGLPDGQWFTYAEDGTTRLTQREFSQGTRHGTWNIWYSSGQKNQEVHYHEDRLEGTRLTWYENGQQQSEENFKEGARHGRFASWDESGELLEDFQYENNQRS